MKKTCSHRLTFLRTQKVRPYYLVFFSLLSCSVFAGEIALTFDDAPTKNSPIMTGNERTTKIIAALKTANVPDALFFVNTDKFDIEGEKRIRRYIDAGYHIANHSHSHRSANAVSVKEYIDDVFIAHEKLKEYQNFLLLHRFPYINYGKTIQTINTLQDKLKEMGYEDGYITIDNFDWYINAALLKAKKSDKNIDYPKLKTVYVDIIWQTILFYDNMAKNTLRRSPKHVLLLHENDTSALFLPELVRHIREQGWKIISPQEAYTDPIARAFPDVEHHGQGRIAAIAHINGEPLEKLRHPSENTDYLDERFREEKIFQ